MSEEKVSLEFLATRVAALTDRMQDLELRFSALEARFSGFLAAIDARFDGFERRFGVQEERTSRMLAILVRLAERQGLPPEGPCAMSGAGAWMTSLVLLVLCFVVHSLPAISQTAAIRMRRQLQC